MIIMFQNMQPKIHVYIISYLFVQNTLMHKVIEYVTVSVLFLTEKYPHTQKDKQATRKCCRITRNYKR